MCRFPLNNKSAIKEHFVARGGLAWVRRIAVGHMSVQHGFHLTRTGQVGGESSRLVMLIAATRSRCPQILDIPAAEKFSTLSKHSDDWQILRVL